MTSEYFIGFGLALIISLGVTPLVRKLAFRIGAVDKPSSRKVHAQPIPRLGGVGIVTAFLVPFVILADFDRALLGLLLGIVILFSVGLIDDLKRLRARTKLFWQLIAAGVVLAGGIGIVYVTNPFGGVINLDGWRLAVTLGPLSFNILPLANAVSLLWIVGMVNTVNFLDGLDGLAAGVSAIACLVLFTLALTPGFHNVTVALLAMILLGALLGFLPYNFFPSRIFMGDSGAYVLGLILALLAIYAGSKITIGVLVLGLAIIDALWTIIRRLVSGRSPFKPDRSHLHHLLHDWGVLSHREVVLLFYLITALIAVTTIFLGAKATGLLLLILMLATISLARIISPKRAIR